MPVTVSPFQYRTLVALMKGYCGPATLSGRVFHEDKYQTAIRRGAAPGTGLVRPMLSILARLKKLDLVEWFSDDGNPVQWRITPKGIAALKEPK